LIVVIWLGVGWSAGLYGQPSEEDLRQTLKRVVNVEVLSTLLLFAFIFVFNFQHVSRILVAFYAVTDLVLMVLLRVAVERFGARWPLRVAGRHHFLIVGSSPDAIDIACALEANERRGVELSGFAGVGNEPQESKTFRSPKLERSYPLYSVNDLPELLRRHVIDEVIFAVSKDELDRLENTFLICEQEGVRTRLSLSFFPHVISRVSLEHLREMPLLTFSTTPENEVLILVKRVMDFAMAALMFAVLSPVMLLLAVLIKLTSRGPVLYRQTRCGLGGRKFTLYKFRSMHAGADLRKEELEALNEADGPVFKIRYDPRCTHVGRLMRRLSLDELPQLLNILKGDMSFVGPRPPLPEEVERYELWQRRRLRMQPGLTCLWAIEGRSRLSFKRWMELDLEYIDRWSPLLDWKILLKTIPAVLLGRGAS
jgi:exopolysaccharide biosynthesis polyprenyl glycosylphosphotransferase